MTASLRRRLVIAWKRVAATAMLLTGACLLTVEASSGSQGADGPARPTARAAEQGPRWPELKPSQQAALRPLEHEWTGIDARSKQKWLELSGRFPKLTVPEQARIQERMTAWAKLTPYERGEARLNFQQAKQLPSGDRLARWEAYQALTPEQRERLAARAAPAPVAPVNAVRRAASAPGAKGERPGREVPQAKSNIVPDPDLAALPRTVAPTVVRARPGATTTLITRQPSPPVHQQSGMPKIAATPEFVDRATLLPQRGPQGAAVRPAAPLAPEAPPRR